MNLLIAAVLFTGQSNDLSIDIRMPAKSASLSLTSKFQVQLKNTTQQTVTIMKQECSWGYESLAFELCDPKGKIYSISQQSHGWKQNFTMPEPIKAKGQYVRDIDFGATYQARSAEKLWMGFPKSLQRGDWKIRAKFCLAPTRAYKGITFWSGTITSLWVKFTGK